jgi:hypothetical protein
MPLQVSIIDLVFSISARAMRAEELLESARGQVERFRNECFRLEAELRGCRPLCLVPVTCSRLPDDDYGPRLNVYTYTRQTTLDVELSRNDRAGLEIYAEQKGHGITIPVAAMRAYLDLSP